MNNLFYLFGVIALIIGVTFLMDLYDHFKNKIKR